MNIEMDATDRTGCKAFCGLRYRDFETTDGVCRAGAEAAYDSWLENVGIQALDEPGDGFDRHVWCSDHCRDARLPPIAAPQSKIEVKATVDGKCPLCGVAVPSTHIHLCSPKHVERRKGQRWKCQHKDGDVEFTIVGTGTMGFWKDDRGMLWDDNCWDAKSVWTMELLTDAPAEPGKATTPQCESFCRPGLRCKYCTTEVAMPAPPAQEAPKAAPVCGSCGKSRATVAMRFVAEVGAQYPWCEPCYLGVEMQYSARTANATGTPYKGPERLRNVLARDEGIESSCWPESDR